LFLLPLNFWKISLLKTKMFDIKLFVQFEH